MRLPNGYGTIYKMSGKRRKKYRVCLPAEYNSENDKVYRPTLGYFTTRQEALDALNKYHGNKEFYNKSKLTFANLFEEWYNMHTTDLSDSAKKNYRSSFNGLKSIHNILVEDLNLIQMQRAIDERPQGSKKFTKSLLVMVMEYAVKTDIIEKNKAKYIEVGKIEKTIIRKVFTEKEIALLWQSQNELWAKYLLIMIYSGIRLGELTTIESKNVHIDEDYFICGIKTKAGKDRIIPIHRKIKPIFQEFLKNKTPLLVNEIKRTKNSVRTYITRSADKKGLDHTTHDCRHTFTSLLAEKNVNMILIRKIVGHSAGNVTEDTYIKISLLEMIKAVNLIDV